MVTRSFVQGHVLVDSKGNVNGPHLSGHPTNGQSYGHRFHVIWWRHHDCSTQINTIKMRGWLTEDGTLIMLVICQTNSRIAMCAICEWLPWSAYCVTGRWLPWKLSYSSILDCSTCPPPSPPPPPKKKDRKVPRYFHKAIRQPVYTSPPWWVVERYLSFDSFYSKHYSFHTGKYVRGCPSTRWLRLCDYSCLDISSITL